MTQGQNAPMSNHNPLNDPANHTLETLLREIKRGRPAASQHIIDMWLHQLEVMDKLSFEREKTMYQNGVDAEHERLLSIIPSEEKGREISRELYPDASNKDSELYNDAVNSKINFLLGYDACRFEFDKALKHQQSNSTSL